MANNVKFKSPALPIPPAQYNQSLYQRTFSVLRLYFNQLDEHLRQDLGDTTINGALAVNHDFMELTSSTANSTTAELPIFSLFRNGGNGIDNAELGGVRWYGTNASGQKAFYAGMYAEVTDESNSGAQVGCIKWHLADGSGSTVPVTDVTVDPGGDEDPVMTLHKYGLVMNTSNDIFLGRYGVLTFEGDSANSNETSLYVVDPTADRTILLPDADGTIALTTMTAPLTINSTTTSADLVIRNNENSSADASPIVELYRAQSVGADGEDLGKIEFYGSNDRGFSSGGPEKILYASVYTEIGDASDGSEDGNLRYSKVVAGAQQLGDLVTQPLNGGVQFPAQSAAPSSPANGQVYYDTDDHKLKLYANGSFVDLN